MKLSIKPKGIILTMIAVLLALALTALALAQSGGGFDLTWNTVDGGGGESAGDSYSLSGTIGQAEAGVMSGGSYTLSGGFWGGASAVNLLHLPLIQR